MDELTIWLIGAMGSIGAIVALFIWNFVSAPYYIQKERADALEGEMATLREQASLNRPNFRIDLENLTYQV